VSCSKVIGLDLLLCEFFDIFPPFLKAVLLKPVLDHVFVVFADIFLTFSNSQFILANFLTFRGVLGVVTLQPVGFG
jgi:hypothetical protein